MKAWTRWPFRPLDIYTIVYTYREQTYTTRALYAPNHFTSNVLNEQQSKEYFYKFYENLVNPLCSKVIPVFYLTHTLYVYTTNSMLIAPLCKLQP